MTTSSENPAEDQAFIDSTTPRFIARFTGLQRVHGVYLKPGPAEPGKKREGKRWTAKEPVTDALYAAHLAGNNGLGIVPIRDDDTCLWGCGDIDDYSVDHPALLEKIKAFGLPLIVCRTKSGGAHALLFASEPIPRCADARQVKRVDDRAWLSKHRDFPEARTLYRTRGTTRAMARG